MEFRLYELRFHFAARRAISFGAASNLLRGRFGAALRALDAAAYREWFEPKSQAGPSGLADPPRPFVFRAAHLEGRAVAAGEAFHIGFHHFDMRRPRLALLEAVFARLLPAALSRIDGTEAPLPLPLDPASGPATRVRVAFLTPTEIKAGGALADEPVFEVLAARARDRIATLANLYGDGPVPLDFAGFAERAAQIRMTRCDLRRVAATRRSARTGQVHPLGGFIGEAEYRGDLREFLPFLRAAQWTGVGRQTAWGKGAIAVQADPA
jgi:hypothetical protein